MKFVYLWFYLASATFLTFVSLYLRAIHLTGAQIGFTISIVPLAGVVLQPVWGFVSDRYHRRKLLLTFSLLVSSLIASAVVLAHSFVVLLLLIVALAVAISPAIPLSDATTLEWLGRHGGSYGAVRIYGSIGFLIGSVVAGPLLGGNGIHWLFPLYGLFLAGTFLVSLSAPRQGPPGAAVHRAGMQLVLRDRVVVVFLALAALGFGASAAYNTFFALYMHGLGASTSVIGFAAGLASLSELPVMALSGRVIARLGVKPLLLAGLGAATIRWLSYGLVQDYRLVLLLQAAHGLSFAASYVAGVTLIDLQVPPQLRSTGQTLFYGATFGVGAVAGSNLFGSLYDHVGAHGIFLAAAGLSAIAVLGMACWVPNRRLSPEVP